MVKRAGICVKPLSRRHWLLAALPTPLLVHAQAERADSAIAQTADRLKPGYARRLKRLLAQGHLPYIDIESSCNARNLNMAGLARQLDDLHIGLMALSADPGDQPDKAGGSHNHLSETLAASYPDRFIPVGNGGQPPNITEYASNFMDGQQAVAMRGDILLLGEYEFRHYPSPRQVRRGEHDRDVDVAIDGALGHRLFGLSEQLNIAFQIHNEIEDRLLAPLEQMLTRYPKAKVIWCHLAQIRYLERATRYSVDYVAGLIERFPNLYFDTAFADARSIYPVSQQRHARVWNNAGHLADDWKELIVAHPEKFLSALDLGGDRMQQIGEYDRRHREFLNELPQPARHQVAYRNAWRLLFSEEFS